MHLPEIDKYANLNSIFHSWDPRMKIVSFSVLIVSVALLPTVPLAAIGLFMALVLLALSRIPVLFVLKRLRWVFPVIIFFFIIMPLTVPGETGLKFAFLKASQKGFILAALLIRLINSFPIQEYVGTPVLSVTVAAVTGIVLGLIGFLAGFFPARKASRLDPVECLRY